MTTNPKIESMKRQLTELQSKSHAVKSKVDHKRGEVDNLKKELQRHQADLLTLENELVQAEAGVKHMVEKIQSEERAQELEEKNEREAKQHEHK